MTGPESLTLNLLKRCHARFSNAIFIIRSWEICCGAERDSEQVHRNHLIVNTCEYTVQKNYVCLQISLHPVLN